MKLGIVGAGGLGREVYIVAKKINAVKHRWDEIFFMDTNRSITEVLGVRCLDVDEAMQTIDDLEVVVAIGEPRIREKVYNDIHNGGKELATLIHPGVYIDETTTIGKGCIICEGVTITSCVEIGDNTFVHPHAVIGHDIKIGKHCMIGANSEIGGANVIGDRSYFGFMSGTKELLTIGQDVICSAGAIVFRDLPDGVIAVGNPARIMKNNDDKTVFRHAKNKAEE